MKETLCFLFFFGLSIQTTNHIQHLTELFDSSLDNNNLDGFDIHKDTIARRLQELRQEKLRCFYRMGVNDASFRMCCGDHYNKIKKSYLSQLDLVKLDLSKSFNDNLKDVCSLDHSSCEELSASFNESIRADRDLLLELGAKKEEVETDPAVNQHRLDKAFDRFRRNYVAFVNSRNLIAHSLSETIDDIRRVIKDSGVHLSVNTEDFDLHAVYKQLGLLEEKNKEGEETHEVESDFNGSLMKEATSKKLLNYYLANGILDKGEIDMTRLPSEILGDFKEKISKMKHKVDV